MENAHDVKPRLAEVASRLSSKEIPCIFCKKLWESRLTIINDKKDILGALDALGVKYEPIPGVVDYACYKCVYRINVIIDFRRLLERNINKTRANYYYAQGNKDMCRKFLLCNDANISNTANSTSSDNLNLLITDVRSEREPERTADFLFDCFNDPDMYTQHYAQENDENALNSPARLLEPMFETDFAETGGMNRSSGNKYKNYNNLNDNKYNYKCQFCTKTYKMLHFLKKHERRHRVHSRKSSTRSATITPPSFECDRCHEVYESRQLLKNHQKSHRNRMKCSYCTAEFYLYHDLELHEAKCYGELSAREETDSINTHYTRSRRKRRKMVDESEQGSTETEMDTVYNVRMKNVDHWVDNVDINYNSDSASEYTRHDDDDRMSMSSHASSHMSTFSRPSTLVSGTSYTATDRSSVISAQVHERVTYDKPKLNRKLLSTKSSVYGDSNRTRAGLHRAEQLKRLDDFLVKSNDENQFSSQNWKKIRKQVKRQSKATKNYNGNSKPVYYCQYAKCYFFNESLLEMMDHDIKVHNQLPLYRCSECQLRFTRPNYLQCHQMDHAAKHHPCHLCNESFDYIHQWKYHLELHAIRTHKCPYCPRSFLKETELDNHLRENSHFNMTPSVNVIPCKLFGDTCNGLTDNEKTVNDNENRSKQTDAYAVFVRLQQSEEMNRQKYERVRWSLASELSYYAGINQLTFEEDNMGNEPIIRGEADLSFDDDLANAPKAKEPPIMNGPTTAIPTEDISEKVIEDPLRPQSPIDFEKYQLFSVDTLDVTEPEEETVVDVPEKEKADKITLRRKQRMSQWAKTIKFPTKLDLFDPPLPSYSSLTNPRAVNSRIRIFPFVIGSQPSRLPC